MNSPRRRPPPSRLVPPILSTPDDSTASLPIAHSNTSVRIEAAERMAAYAPCASNSSVSIEAAEIMRASASVRPKTGASVRPKTGKRGTRDLSNSTTYVKPKPVKASALQSQVENLKMVPTKSRKPCKEVVTDMAQCAISSKKFRFYLQWKTVASYEFLIMKIYIS